MIEACQSPVWDTCLADHRARRRRTARRPPPAGQGRRLDARRADRPARRLVRAAGPNSPPGGWAFEFHNDNYPDIDDTAEVVLALRRVKHPDPERVENADRARRCAGTSACSRRTAPGAPSTSTTPARSPTGCRSATSARSSTRRPPTSPRTWWRCSPSRACRTTRAPGAASSGCSPNRSRTAPGSAAGASTTSTAPVRWCPPSPPPASPPRTRRSAARSPGWRRCRTTTAAGARTCAPTGTKEWSGRGASTASQTAWALMALLAAGERDSKAVERGVAWLAETQLEDGTWDEPYFTGTGFPWDFSINYHLYRQVFPLTALGRYVHGEPFRRRPGRRLMPAPAARARGPAAAGRLRARHRAPRPAQRRPRRAPTGPVTVLRTGMGPEAAERSVTRAPGRPGAARTPRSWPPASAPGSPPGCTPVTWSSPRRPGTRAAPRRASAPNCSSRS